VAHQRPRLRAAAAIGLAGLAGAGLWRWTGSGSEAEPSRIVVADADLERGAALYAEHCGACHGPELEGQPDWRSPLPSGRLRAPRTTPAAPPGIMPTPPCSGSSVRHRAVVGGGYESDMPGFDDP
jgi:mono/diheme cytochrome c family protein